MEIREKNARVYLKSLSIDDADQIAEQANHYEIAHNIAELGKFPHPYQRADALTFIDYAMKTGMDGMELHFGIRLVETDELIGVLGLKAINMTSGKAEVGYWIGKNFWSRGYGGEAVSIVVNYGFTRLELNRIYANVFAPNTASSKILEKIGFVKEGVMREHVVRKDGYVDEVAFGLLKRDYKSNLDITIKE